MPRSTRKTIPGLSPNIGFGSEPEILVKVSDEKILEAQYELARSAGVFCEPSSACAYAGFVEIADKLPKESIKVVLATGHGLKDINSALKIIEVPEAIKPNIDNINIQI